jgi:hypothetical protein
MVDVCYAARCGEELQGFCQGALFAASLPEQAELVLKRMGGIQADHVLADRRRGRTLGDRGVLAEPLGRDEERVLFAVERRP